MKQIVVTIGLIAAVLLASCAQATPAATPTPKPTVAIPGQEGSRMVDVGGHKLFTRLRGQDHPGPLVVLEHGYGSSWSAWDRVAMQVEDWAPVLAYGRAGYGTSEVGPDPRTAERIADELHALLAATEFPPPYVLVGHSFGGFILRAFAAKYPADVAGLVLVDGAHEDLDQVFKEIAPAKFAESEAAAETWRATKAPKGAIQEYAAMEQTREQMRQITSLPDVPAVILSAGLGEAGDPPELRKEFTALQYQWLALLPHGRQVVVEDSGHQIPMTHPKPVVDAIREVLDAVK